MAARQRGDKGIPLRGRQAEQLPIRKGFGSRLLAASAMQLNAELGLDYRPEGLVCRIRFDVPRASGEVR